MPKFKEKPRMSSTAGQGQNFRRQNNDSFTKKYGKKLWMIIPIILVIVYTISNLIDGEKDKITIPITNSSSTSTYTTIDDFISNDGSHYSVFKVKFSNDICNRIYVEQNQSKRKINDLLEKISNDRLTKSTVSNSLFKNENHFFAITAAMFENDNLPPGLLISGFRKFKNINLSDGGGNFYLKPNGVFSISKFGKIQIQETQKFNETNDICFALQSGPMLVSDNIVNSGLPENSTNINIRSAVGVNKDELIFVISKSEVNFYDIAELMKNEMKCTDALHLESAAFAFMDFPESSYKKTFNNDTEIRNLIIIR